MCRRTVVPITTTLVYECTVYFTVIHWKWWTVTGRGSSVPVSTLNRRTSWSQAVGTTRSSSGTADSRTPFDAYPGSTCVATDSTSVRTGRRYSSRKFKHAIFVSTASITRQIQKYRIILATRRRPWYSSANFVQMEFLSHSPRTLVSNILQFLHRSCPVPGKGRTLSNYGTTVVGSSWLLWSQTPIPLCSTVGNTWRICS